MERLNLFLLCHRKLYLVPVILLRMMNRTVVTALILAQAQATYFFATIGVGFGYPKPVAIVLLIAQWVATTRLLDHVAAGPVRRGLALWLVFSPLFLLPSAVAIWRIHLFGFNPTHAAPAIIVSSLVVALYGKTKWKIREAVTITLAISLFIVGVAFNAGAPLYASAIYSAAAGILLSTHPLIHVQTDTLT